MIGAELPKQVGSRKLAVKLLRDHFCVASTLLLARSGPADSSKLFADFRVLSRGLELVNPADSESLALSY